MIDKLREEAKLLLFLEVYFLSRDSLKKVTVLFWRKILPRKPSEECKPTGLERNSENTFEDS